MDLKLPPDPSGSPTLTPWRSFSCRAAPVRARPSSATGSAKKHGFVHIETDSDWDTWGRRVCVQSLQEAVTTHNQVRSHGPDVVIEWGFIPEYLGYVRQLRGVGFDAWWLDGDEEAARQGYINRRGNSPEEIAPYLVQLEAIQAAWPQLKRFYGDHIIRTVTAGPTYMPFDEVLSVMLPDL